MNTGRLLWVAGGYMAGTLPSTFIVARLRGAGDLIAASGRGAGETDPHVLMSKRLGAEWSAVAATTDVLKALVYVLVARGWGHLAAGWLAATGFAVVAGHTYPFYAKRMAGRGLAAASGVLLVLLPIEMTIAGLLFLLGAAVRSTGLASTIGFGSVAPIAAIQGQPWQLVAMGGAIFGLILIRRVEGVGAVVRSGVSWGRAVLYRCLFDSSGRPSRRHPGGREWGAPRSSTD
jgi:acyl phosphate:glycerol-3-phosphate acyltransferase